MDRRHEEGRHQLALHPKTHSHSSALSGRQQLTVAPVDGCSPPARLGPVVALVWRSKGDGGGVKGGGVCQRGPCGGQGLLDDHRGAGYKGREQLDTTMEAGRDGKTTFLISCLMLHNDPRLT